MIVRRAELNKVTLAKNLKVTIIENVKYTNGTVLENEGRFWIRQKVLDIFEILIRNATAYRHHTLRASASL